MKNIIVSIFLLSPLFSGAQEKPKTLSANSKRVTVYLQGATIHSLHTVNLVQGENQISIEGVSPYIQEQTIEVSGKGDFSIMESKLEIKYPDKAKQKQTESKYTTLIKQLEDSLAIVKIELDEILERKTNCNSEKQLLLNNRIVKGEVRRDSIETLRGALDYAHKRLDALASELTKIRKDEFYVSSKKNGMEKRYNEYVRLRAEIEGGVKQENKPIYAVNIIIQSNAAVNGQLDLAYFVGNASWAPEYDIRVQKESDKLKLIQKAKVMQYCGIDWIDTKLQISTSTPGYGHNKPTMYPHEIGMNYPMQTRSAGVHAKAAMKKEMATMDLDAAPQMAAAEGMNEPAAGSAVDYTQVNEGMTNLNYEINFNYDVPSDSKYHHVIIRESELNAKMVYYIVPKYDVNAFLNAQVTGYEDLNLISGDARIYMDGSYVATNYLNVNTLNDTLNIDLGRDRNIEAKRIRIKEKEQDKLLSDKITRKFGYEITLRNPKAVAMDFIIEDQVPITRNKDVEINVKELGGAIHDKVSGKLTWKQSIKSKETLKLRFNYDVTYPNTLQMHGL